MKMIRLLLVGLLLPQMLLALDAETQRLEQEVLCQAMPYRAECGGSPAPPTAPVPPGGARGAPQSLPLESVLEPPEVTRARLHCASYGDFAVERARIRDLGYSLASSQTAVLTWDATHVTPDVQRDHADILTLVYAYQTV